MRSQRLDIVLDQRRRNPTCVAHVARWVAVVAAVSGCGSSAKQQPKTSAQAPIVLTCREAVFDEARLLDSSLGESSAPKGLAIQLDEIAASLDVTWETLESLRQLRTTAYQLLGPKRPSELATAADAVAKACADLDKPEERAKAVLDKAIELLAEEKFVEFIEGYVPPKDVAGMKESGQLDATVARFRQGFGRQLHDQLVRARAATPVLNRDGSVTFQTAARDGGNSYVIVLEPIGGRFFFRQ